MTKLSVGYPHLHTCINVPAIDSRIRHMVNLSLPLAVVLYWRKCTLDTLATNRDKVSSASPDEIPNNREPSLSSLMLFEQSDVGPHCKSVCRNTSLT